jgi:hypothetical protein
LIIIIIIIIVIIPYLCAEGGPMPDYKVRRITKNIRNHEDQCKAR